MKNKTVAALMAAIALCAALTACGSDSGETSAKISGAPAETAVDTSAKVNELRANAKADALLAQYVPLADTLYEKMATQLRGEV